MAIPVQGHTAVALACTYANCNPNFPATKYTAARPATVARFFSSSDHFIPHSPPRPRSVSHGPVWERESSTAHTHYKASVLGPATGPERHTICPKLLFY